MIIWTTWMSRLMMQRGHPPSIPRARVNLAVSLLILVNEGCRAELRPGKKHPKWILIPIIVKKFTCLKDYGWESSTATSPLGHFWVKCRIRAREAFFWFPSTQGRRNGLAGGRQKRSAERLEVLRRKSSQNNRCAQRYKRRCSRRDCTYHPTNKPSQRYPTHRK